MLAEHLRPPCGILVFRGTEVLEVSVSKTVL